MSELDAKSERKIRSDIMLKSIQKVGWFETIWYPFFIIASLVAFVLITVLEKSFNWILLVALIELIICMVANNLVARGKRYGLLISSVSITMYIVISYLTQVWGEVIINVFLFLPLELYGFFAWKKKVDKTDKLDEIVPTSYKRLTLDIIALVVGSAAIWALLRFVVHQEFAIFNAISIMAFLIGTLVRNKRYKYFWYFYMIGNAAGALLWILVSTNVNLGVVPNALSFFATLSNNFNGLFIWNKLFKETKKTEGVVLSKRKVNIKKVIKLKNTYATMLHNIEVQPDVVQKINSKKSPPKVVD